MKYAKILGLLAMVILLVGLTGCERRVVVEGGLDRDIDGASYVGSSSCGVSGCHESLYESFIKTGHPYKLNKASDAQQDDFYPYTIVPDPPSIIGNDWSRVSHVIGGHRWKARYVDTDGYVVTGDAVQWNFETETFVGYHADEGLGTKPYDCGPCHTTGYRNEGNQDGLPGLIGQWDEGGIHCEECHGNGEFHIEDPVNNHMTIDRSMEMCGQCHVRGTPYAVPASGGFIKHHEQYNEILGSKHSTLDCVDCHDPHMTLHPDEPSRDLAIRRTCESCHHGEANSYDNSTLPHAGENIDCIDCHMPRAGKSAVADSDDFYGDIRSHLFTVNTLEDAEQFTPDGKFANPYLTLNYMCKNCHTDKDTEWMATWAADIHAGEIASASSCFTCHSDNNSDFIAAQQEYANSKHGSGDNIDRNRNNNSRYSACEQCHTNEGFVAELTGVAASGDHFTAITCFTCHEPHTTGSLNLRAEGPYTLRNGEVFDYGKGNLCVRCHHSRQDVREYVADSITLSSHWGPHYSDQGDMIVGSGGYEYDGYTYESSAHTAVLKDGCIDCHMTGSFANRVGGHTWKVYDEELNREHLVGCNVPACHGTTGPLTTFNRQSDVDFDGDGTTEGVQDEIQGLLDDLAAALITAGLLEGDAEDGFHPVNGRVVIDSDSSGALYNYEIVAEERSLGVHNTKYAVGLLQSGLNFLTTGNPNGVAPRTKLDELTAAH